MKRFIAFLLVVCLISTLGLFSVTANGAKAEMSSCSANRGETVILTVKVEDVAKTNALAFELELPEGITFVEEGTAWEIDGDIKDFIVEDNRGIWAYVDKIDASGTVLSLAFEVGEDAACGENEINFELFTSTTAAGKTPEAATEIAGIINVSHDGKDGKCTACGVMFTSATMSSEIATYGETVVLTVEVANAPVTDAMAFQLTLPEGITFLEEGSAWEIDGEIQAVNVAKLRGAWVESEEIDVNGLILSLAFRVEETAKLGKNVIAFEFYHDDEQVGVDAVGEKHGVITVCAHDFSGELQFDDENHWSECPNCGTVKDVAKHEFDNACDTTCNGCGYTRETTHDAGKWLFDEKNHWHECSICHEILDKDEHDATDGACTVCCGKEFYIAGDVDNDKDVDSNDAIYLLYHVFFGAENYPVNQSCDFDKSSRVDSADAIYLLYHVFFGSELYPII